MVFEPNIPPTMLYLPLQKKIRESLDSGKFACGVFIDLQKAFDTVDHSILLKEMEHYGIKGLADNWFRSYLTGRTQYTSANSFDSEYRDMKYGVPQGSGPWSTPFSYLYK